MAKKFLSRVVDTKLEARRQRFLGFVYNKLPEIDCDTTIESVNSSNLDGSPRISSIPPTWITGRSTSWCRSTEEAGSWESGPMLRNCRSTWVYDVSIVIERVDAKSQQFVWPTEMLACVHELIPTLWPATLMVVCCTRLNLPYSNTHYPNVLVFECSAVQTFCRMNSIFLPLFQRGIRVVLQWRANLWD